MRSPSLAAAAGVWCGGCLFQAQLGRAERIIWHSLTGGGLNPGGTKIHTNFFCTNFFEHPQGSGTSRQKFRDIPDSSLKNPRKINFRGRARTFRPLPLRVEGPHPTGRSPDPTLCSFFCPDKPRNDIRVSPGMTVP